MFDFTESILIHAPHEKVWNVVRDIDQWWLRSNPDHEALEHLDERPATQVGAKLRIRENRRHPRRGGGSDHRSRTGHGRHLGS